MKNVNRSPKLMNVLSYTIRIMKIKLSMKHYAEYYIKLLICRFSWVLKKVLLLQYLLCG